MSARVPLPEGVHYAVAVPCTSCGALPGVRCLNRFGNRQDRPHAARVAAWAATATARERLLAMVHTPRTEDRVHAEAEVLAALDAFAAEVRAATLRLTPGARQLLAYACELVGDQIALQPDEWEPGDKEALAELRGLAAGAAEGS